MRAAVMNHSGFQPFSVGASRLALASVVLFAWAYLARRKLRLNRSDLLVCAVSGNLIWLGGNALVMWAEQWVDAGYATLIFSTLPICTILIGCLIDRQKPSSLVLIAALMALGGMTMLGGSQLFARTQNILVPTLTIFVSVVLWSFSTHLQKRRPLKCSPLVGSAYQQLFGALGVFIVALLAGETWPHPSQQAWAAWAYLVMFGSIIAYSSYIEVVRHFPPSISMTFAYVCPVLTVIFGHFLLGEPLNANRMAGMAVILSSVLLIFHDQRRQARAIQVAATPS
jgi:drug/metabolite transporter (DMT)-like permease